MQRQVLYLGEINDSQEAEWRKVLQLLVINRLCDPGSEFTVHRRWFLRSAMEVQAWQP